MNSDLPATGPAAHLYRIHLRSRLPPVHSVNLRVRLLPEQRAGRKFAGLRRQTQGPGVRGLSACRCRVGVAGLRQINAHRLAPLLAGYFGQPWSVGLSDATDLPTAGGGFKKSTGQSSAAHAALGGRTLKSGQSRCFVGYKKHPLRLWLPHYLVGVQLVALVSWVTPANVSESGLPVPSLHYCPQQWAGAPPRVVADTGYLGAAAKQQCRERWRVAVLTKLRSDIKRVPPEVTWVEAAFGCIVRELARCCVERFDKSLRTAASCGVQSSSHASAHTTALKSRNLSALMFSLAQPMWSRWPRTFSDSRSCTTTTASSAKISPSPFAFRVRLEKFWSAIAPSSITSRISNTTFSSTASAAGRRRSGCA